MWGANGLLQEEAGQATQVQVEILMKTYMHMKGQSEGPYTTIWYACDTDKILPRLSHKSHYIFNIIDQSRST